MFAFLVYEHRRFKWVVRAVWVYQKEDQKLDFEFLDPTNLQKYSPTPEQTEWVALSDKNSDTSIYKKFSRLKFKTLRDFLSSVSDEEINNFIRPQIERTGAELILAAIRNKIPVYQKIYNNITIHNRLTLIGDSAQIHFTFNLNPDGLVYSAELFNNHQPIDLLNQTMVTLSREPAIFIIDNNLFYIKDIKSPMIEAFTRNEKIRVQPKLVPKYFETFVSAFLGSFDAVAQGFVIEDRATKPKPLLTIKEGIASDYEINLTFYYQDTAVTGHAAHSRFVVKQLPDYHFVRYRRDFEFENRIINLLKNKELREVSPFTFIVSKKYVNEISWVNHHIGWLNEQGIEVKTELSAKYYLGEIKLSVQTREKTDWFEINAVLELGEFSIPIIKLKKQILSQQREIVLPNGDIALLPDELLTRLKDLLEMSNIENGTIRLNRFNIHYINRLSPETISVTLPEIAPKQPTTLPNLPVSLREYQKIGFYWLRQLYTLKTGGILADDMGLGKTLQVITLLKSIYFPTDTKTTGTIKQLSLFDPPEILASPVAPSLIVVPTSLIYNWLNELNRFAPELRTTTYAGQRRRLASNSLSKANVVITTYGVLRNDIERLAKIEFETIVLDESQAIKNPESAIFAAVKLLNGKTKITLTGTPIENSLTDLWAQMDFVNPGYFGALNYFKNRFVGEIEKRRNEERASELKKLIQPFVLRRSKSEVARELPEKMEQTIYCTMPDEQEKLYQQHLSAVRNEILSLLDNPSRQSQSKIIALKELMHLRLLANHPKIAGYSDIEVSGKQLVVQNHLEELYQEGHKTLIFSSFVRQLKLYTDFCDANGYRYVLLTGQTPQKERISLVNQFQSNPDIRFFFISLKTGGFGLNLQAADYVLLLDPWWNPQAENQAIDRTHRIGQTNNVFIYRYITKNSVEEKMQQIQERKRLLSNDFISHNIPKTLSLEEIEELLKSN